MAADGEIGSVADFGYSFMGATDPGQIEPLVLEITGFLTEDQINAVLLAPV